MDNKAFQMLLVTSGSDSLQRYFANLDKYDGLELKFTLTKQKKFDEETLNLFTQLLANAGFVLEINNNILTIRIKGENLSKVKHSKAGRRKKGTNYKFSDIVVMLQTMTDKEIAEAIDMPIATYYRHKKAMKESIYYNSLDKNKLNDLNYLESVSGNKPF